MVVSTTKRYVGYPPEIPVAYRERPWMVDLPIKFYQTWFSVPVRYVSLQWPDGKWSKNREKSWKIHKRTGVMISTKGKDPNSAGQGINGSRDIFTANYVYYPRVNYMKSWKEETTFRSHVFECKPLRLFFLKTNQSWKNMFNMTRGDIILGGRVDNLPRVSVHLCDC